MAVPHRGIRGVHQLERGPTLWKVFGLSRSPTALGNSGVQSPAWWKPFRAGVFAHRHGLGGFDLQGQRAA